jgi:dihydrofolate synthase/folylpolyglutamate synthase
MNSSYPKALAYLYGFTDYEKQSGFSYDPERFDLRRVEQLLALLGDPHRTFRSVHIAGTKGKGSTSAMIASIVHAAGYRTALYTSPHLHTFRERIQIDGGMISEDQVVAGVERLRAAAAQVPAITTFELITALAFDHFCREGAEVAVVEVGMGGRLDATNVLMPLATTITSISFDHMMYLGNTLAAIAGEKAGIVKPGVPLVSAPQEPEALEVIEQTAVERGSPLTLVGRDWLWESIQVSTEGQQFAAWPTAAPGTKTTYSLPLLGRHQQVNAVTALATVGSMQRAGFQVSDAASLAGLENVRWPGRVEILGRTPWVIVDGAHNGDSMRRLGETLRELFPYRKMILVLGVSADKDLDRMFPAILPLVDRVLVTRANHPRAASVEKLVECVTAYGKRAEPVALDQVIHRAMSLAGKEDLICVTGSLFVVASFRAAWLQFTNQPLPPTDDI